MGNLVFQATLGGQVNLVGPNTASTFNINVPTVNGNMVTTGDTGTVTNTMCATSVYTAPGTIGSGTPNTGAFTTLSASGVATISAGSASAPALTTSGDTNTGMLFPAADTIALTTSGTERLRLDSSGNLGLGVTPSAWGSPLLGAIEMQKGTALTSSSSFPIAYLFANTYYNGTNFIYKTSAYGAYYSVNGGNGQHQWFNAASGTAGNAITFTQAMTLDASGNLGVGTTSPNNRIYAQVTSSTAYSSGVTGNGLTLYNSSATTGQYVGITFNGEPTSGNGGLATIMGTTTGSGNMDLVFSTRGSSTLAERARIDSSGNFGIGTASPSFRLDVFQTGAVNVVNIKGDDAGGSYLARMWQAANSGNNGFFGFLTESAGTGTTRGSITYNRGGGLVAYNVTSDYRAKTVNGAVQNALTKVAALKPCTGRMNGAEFDIDFFVAHELADVVPSAVTGEKDAVNEDGTPNYQMVDKSALIPLLTAAIQEQQAIITQLQADVAALKG